MSFPKGILLTIIVAAPGFIAGCAQDEPHPYNRAPSDTTASLVVADTSSAAGNEQPLIDGQKWTSEQIRIDRAVREVAVVSDLRAGAHDEFDRFVIVFENDVVPGYFVRYLQGHAIECGSGEPIGVAGTAVLEVHMEPARGYDEQGRSTVDHRERPIGMKSIREAEITCDFEAVFTIMLGLARRTAYRVTELQGPSRLVIDVQHETQ